MLNKKNIFKIGIIFLIYILLSSHSPWNQYLAYRAEHLLIMSTREDGPTYPFLKF